jgi:phenylpropionate dioxygenase-like ring-hydroxylating dioxygenase large terminal subunit
MAAAAFLPPWVYGSAAVAERERSHYIERCWHPVAASSALGEGQALAVELAGQPLLLTRPAARETAEATTSPEVPPPRAFLNRCPHRGVALLESEAAPRSCRRLICPYHGWSYDLNGQLLAAAREGEFLEPFHRGDWPLQEVACRQLGPLIWVALGPDPLPLEQQLDLVLAEAGALFSEPRQLLAREQRPLACNWKIAHDNTLDDYHVAIAHPTTLHRDQGPVRLYRHALSPHGTLLATPMVPDGRSEGKSESAGTFFTFGLAPWTHLLLWPDRRLALISFLPAARLDQCTMDVWLFGPPAAAATATTWMAEMQRFLEEDRRLVESAQQGYASGLKPGPAHRLEQRILQWQALYRRLLDLEHWRPPQEGTPDLTRQPDCAASGPSPC